MVGELKRRVSPPVCPASAALTVPPPCRVRTAFMAGRAMVTSCAVIAPDARGDATAGGPEFGKSARRKSPIRRANRFLLKCCRRKTKSPLFLVHLPCARERSLCRTGAASVHCQTRRGPRRYRAVSVEILLRTGAQPCAFSSELPERAYRRSN